MNAHILRLEDVFIRRLDSFLIFASARDPGRLGSSSRLPLLEALGFSILGVTSTPWGRQLPRGRFAGRQHLAPVGLASMKPRGPDDGRRSIDGIASLPFCLDNR